MFYEIPFHFGFRITVTGRVVDLYKRIEIEPTLNKLGYYAVTVRRQGVVHRSITAHIHRLLALTFLVPPDPKLVDVLQVNHKDGNKLNNRLDNLEWVTQQQNCQHAYETGLREDNFRIRLTAANGDNFEVYSQAEAARFLGVTPGAVCWRLKNKPEEAFKGYTLARVA